MATVTKFDSVSFALLIFVILVAGAFANPRLAAISLGKALDSLARAPELFKSLKFLIPVSLTIVVLTVIGFVVVAQIALSRSKPQIHEDDVNLLD